MANCMYDLQFVKYPSPIIMEFKNRSLQIVSMILGERAPVEAVVYDADVCFTTPPNCMYDLPFATLCEARVLFKP